MIPNSIKSSLKDIKCQKTNSSNLIQNHIVLFEEEKRMKEEKLKAADNISHCFRQYEKTYTKSFKKLMPKKETQDLFRNSGKIQKSLDLFSTLCKSISKENPSNGIGLIKLWKYYGEAIKSSFKNTLNEKREKAEVINKCVTDIVTECNNLFMLLDSRNQDILSLVEYIGEMREYIDQA